MKFILSVHLREIIREEESTGRSLKEYAEFIKVNYEASRYLPEEMEVREAGGPTFQTIQHNSEFIKAHFPSMSEDFAKGVSEEVNFKFKEVTEELKAKMDRIKEEKSLIIRTHSHSQKETKAVLKELAQVVGKQLGTIFSAEAEKSEPVKHNLPLQDKRYQSRDFWAKADELMAKMKNLGERRNLFKPSLERSEVTIQI